VHKRGCSTPAAPAPQFGLTALPPYRLTACARNGRPIVWQTNGLRQHYLADHQDEIEVFYLPPYSSELNPDEYLNCDLKVGVHSGTPARSKEQLKQKAKAHSQSSEAAEARKIFRSSVNQIRHGIAI
jgi:hypothetical protein